MNDRFCMIRVKAKFFNISIINPHVPIEDKDNKGKKISIGYLTTTTTQTRYKNCYTRHERKNWYGKNLEKCGRHSLCNNRNDNGTRVQCRVNLEATASDPAALGAPQNKNVKILNNFRKFFSIQKKHNIYVYRRNIKFFFNRTMLLLHFFL